MAVKSILAVKGSDVATVDGSASVGAATKMLGERRIGALLILNPDRSIAGILSERDIVRALGKHGAAALDLPVNDVMTKNVTTCRGDETIADIMSQMTSGKFRHVPVVADGVLIGIISIGDVVKHRVQEMELEAQSLQEYIRTA